MDLKTYVSELPGGGQSALAQALDISSVYLSQLAAKQNGREPSPELCVRIEHGTKGSVRRWELRPSDWSRIWPELIGAKGAPKPARAKAGY